MSDGTTTAAGHCDPAAPIRPNSFSLQSSEQGDERAQEGRARERAGPEPGLAPLGEGVGEPAGLPEGEGPGGAEAAGPASAGVGNPPDDDEACEEARRPEKVRDPSAPTRAQWEEHQATHLPFRAWCPHCVAGRLDTLLTGERWDPNLKCQKSTWTTRSASGRRNTTS